jgi:hypothetical protein
VQGAAKLVREFVGTGVELDQSDSLLMKCSTGRAHSLRQLLALFEVFDLYHAGPHFYEQALQVGVSVCV